MRMRQRRGRKKPKRAESAAYSSDADPAFLAVVRAFAGDRHVTRETRQGFGSGALKVNGKIFAMISSRGEFVVKLPKPRVDDLVRDGVGTRFEPGPGRVMKEWLATSGGRDRWTELAEEAYRFVKTRAFLDYRISTGDSRAIRSRPSM
jgi:hypothetical protein